MSTKNSSKRKLPTALDAAYSTPNANTNVLLYEGAIRLKKGDGEFNGSGTVELRWLPIPDVRFEIEVDGNVDLDPFASDTSIEFTDKWPGEFVDVEIMSTSLLPVHGNTRASGSIHKWTCASSTDIEFAKFHVPNLRSFRGDPISNDAGAMWVGRSELTWNDWKITIDEILNKDLRNELKVIGGFGITHVGVLQKSDGASFSPTEVEDQVEALDWLLSFCNGRWTGPLLIQGCDSDATEVWHEWAARRTAAYRNIRSWYNEIMDDPLPRVCQGFAVRWFDDTWSRAIRIAIYWYIMGNAPGASVENGTMVSQVAFETLGWTLFVEDLKSLSSDGYERLQAADKLRLLLSHSGIDLSVPDELPSLKAAAKADNWADGPAAISAIRNAHVHPSPKNRDRLSRVGSEAEYQATILSMQYLELILLRLFDYSGEYCSRLIGGVYPSGALKPVPWNST